MSNATDDTILHIKMLGDLTVKKNDEDITPLIKRSDNLLKLMCYLIMLKGKTVSATELTDIVFAEQEYENPVKAVNNLIYRLRKMIDGNEATGYIRRTGDGYSWNMAAAFTLDIVDFERAADEGIRSVLAGEPNEQALQQAIDIYQDDFLREMVYENWTVPTRQNYKNKFLRCVDEIIKILKATDRKLDIINICDKAIAIDPYCERLHVAYLDALLAEDRVAHASRHYSYITKLLYNEFGVYASRGIKGRICAHHRQIQIKFQRYRYHAGLKRQRGERRWAVLLRLRYVQKDLPAGRAAHAAQRAIQLHDPFFAYPPRPRAFARQTAGLCARQLKEHIDRHAAQRGYRLFFQRRPRRDLSHGNHIRIGGQGIGKDPCPFC